MAVGGGVNNSSGEKDDPYSSLLTGNVDVPDDKVINDIFSERTTKHADDAIDYEDIDELADEDEEELPEIKNAEDNDDLDVGGAEEHNLQDNANNEFDALFGDEEDANGEHDHGFQAPGHDVLDSHVGMDILDDFSGNMVYEDDGLHHLDLGFEDDKPESMNGKGTMMSHGLKKKRKSLEQIQAKKEKLRKLVQDMETRQKARMVSKYFPDYKPEKPYNHHKMVLTEPKFYAYKRPPIAFKSNLKPLIPLKLSLEVEPDQRKAFRSKRDMLGLTSQQTGITYISQKDLDFIASLESDGDSIIKLTSLPFIKSDGIDDDKFSDFSKDLILATADWDDDSILDAGGSDEEHHVNSVTKKPISEELENEELIYDDDNIFEGNAAPEKLELNMNDPNLLFIPDKKKYEVTKSKAVIPLDQKTLQMKFNISNDRSYDILKSNYNTKVRSQLSNLNIEHSLPALRLQTPYYKIKLTKEQARAFHRAKFQVRQGSLICFSKPKVRKKKKDRGKTAQEIFSSSADLTTTDTSPIIAMEYSEEAPKILSNFGMGSKLINYYRKEKEDDNSRPKAPLGETHVLGVEDRSPFWNFGHVAKGDFVPTLYNNMIRAPVFKQEAKSTDFLLIRSQGCGNHQRYYLKRMDHLFAVGNIFPAVEVPAPHSRKVTNTSKNRLKMIVFRTMNKNGTARLSVKDISSHFPDQNDMQNRQRLKEFMEYQRQGDDQGFWKIRNSSTVPTEEEIRSMITPEDVALLDSMQHGQQVLDDIDSLFNDDSRKVEVKKEKKEKDKTKDKEKEKEDADAEDKERSAQGERKRRDKDVDIDETIDEGSTPWSSSRSFIIANQTKAMLQLNGEGDPSGIGLGFSLLRATQKHGFRPLFPPPKESVPKNTTASYQQRLYEAEVSRIWYAQRSSLTVDNREGHTLEDIYKEYKPANHDEYFKSKFEKEKEDRVKNEGPQSAKRNVLKITRLVRDENDVVQRKVEYVHDPRLIKAYIKRKKRIEGDKMSMVDVNEILPTNDAEMNKIRRRALEEKIANLQKRAKLSKGRKPHKDPLHLAAAAGGTIIDANTVLLPDGSIAFGGKGIGKGKSTTRRCASCGAFGHIRTNKACPLYAHTKGGTVQIPQEQKDILLAQIKSEKKAAGAETATPSNVGTPVLPEDTEGSPSAPQT
ncbi:hypothetical protein CLUG_04086 [Clavispora lusitaniae ATCC 42720]|uniref:Transcription initiation factor TFIID subunit n=1 Tax=Clavispora lusitaniae (strain ATCC 42720) TaxID=306902 RepID=C4Y4U8_CLAL4|nr:uncharacterized protein CLUG_04086 [Clavispora lusitaniae ATCC 42720]EEQ39958.1 hypothetical protein CLUG_04086 [Clavispora lusitaniae ATCC 42720]